MVRRPFFRVFVSVSFLNLTLIVPFKSTADDREVWLSANYQAWQSENEKTRVSVYAETRMNQNAGELYGAFLGPTLRQQISTNFEIGGALKFITLRHESRSFDPRFRVELEATPKIKFGPDEQHMLRLRNRYELFRNTGNKELRRMRHRLELCSKTYGVRYLSAWCVNHELIYKLNGIEYDLTQYRLMPIGLEFKLPENIQLKVYYQIIRLNDQVETYNHALGFSLQF